MRTHPGDCLLCERRLRGRCQVRLPATAKRPDWFFHYYLLAATQAAAGDQEAARKSLAQGQRDRSYNLQGLRIGHPFVNEGLFNHFVDNLRKAGWAG